MTALLRLAPGPYLAAGLLILGGGVWGWGYMKGVSAGRISALQDTVAAYEKRKGIDHEVSGMGAVALCIELGGAKDECASLAQ